MKNSPPCTKAGIRHEVRDRIGAMSLALRQDEMRSVCDQLLRLREFAQAETIVGYEALDDEIDISPILHRARDMGKEVILTSQSRHGTFPVLPDTPKTLIIVPGRAFSTSGQRIGRGGGWYDRFLAMYPQAFRIGVCFGVQIYTSLDEESHDIRVQRVVSGSR